MTFEELYVEARLQELERELAKQRLLQQVRNAIAESPHQAVERPANPAPVRLPETTGW